MDYIIKGLPTNAEKYAALNSSGLLDPMNPTKGPNQEAQLKTTKFGTMYADTTKEMYADADKTAYILTQPEVTEHDGPGLSNPRTMAAYDMDPGSLTDLETYGDATQATYRCEARSVS